MVGKSQNKNLFGDTWELYKIKVSVSINEILLGHSHAPAFRMRLWLLHTPRAGLGVRLAPCPSISRGSCCFHLLGLLHRPPRSSPSPPALEPGVWGGDVGRASLPQALGPFCPAVSAPRLLLCPIRTCHGILGHRLARRPRLETPYLVLSAKTLLPNKIIVTVPGHGQGCSLEGWGGGTIHPGKWFLAF